MRWWKHYAGPVPVLFGHNGRWWDPSVHAELSKGEPQLFVDDPIGPSMAADAKAFCIDFSVGLGSSKNIWVTLRHCMADWQRWTGLSGSGV